jgi:hypothetical protein
MGDFKDAEVGNNTMENSEPKISSVDVDDNKCS